MRTGFVSTLRDEDHFDVQPGSLTAAGRSPFTATVRGNRTDNCLMDRVTAGPHDFSAAAARDGGEDDAPVALLYVVRGGVHGTVAGRPFAAGVGEGLLWDCRVGIDSHAVTETKLLRLLVRRGHAFTETPAPAMAGATVLPATATLQACAAFLIPMTGADLDDLSRESVGRLEHVATTLLAAQIDVAQARPWEPGARTPTREAIEDYIDLHLHDAELTPATIAKNFGVTARTVHNRFLGSGRTAAATIRARRVQDVITRLRADPSHHRISQLASEAGFTSSAALTRSFTEQTGRTPTAFAASLRARGRPGSGG